MSQCFKRSARCSIVRRFVSATQRFLCRPPAGWTLALLAVLGIFSSASPVSAGATLLSRHSVIHASGAAGLDQQQSSDGFSTFANEVGTGDGAINGVRSMAHQYSAPGVLGSAGAGLEGAFGEGQVRSQTSNGNSAQAMSGFDMTFSVDSRPAVYTIGAAMGSAGNGTVLLELVPLTGTTRSGSPVFISQTTAGEGGDAGASREVDTSGFLAPGRYMFSVRADSQEQGSRTAESNAYYTFSFGLTDTAGVGSTPPVAVPLPGAAWAGGSLLGLVAGRQILRRRRA